MLLRRESGTPSLITNIPNARATDDFDVILTLEGLADALIQARIAAGLTREQLAERLRLKK